MLNPLRSGAADIDAAFKMRAVWIALASEDIIDQHRRTTLGPAWLLINYLAFAGTFVLLFADEAATVNFTAYVSIGLLIWLYISETIILSISLFAREESFIKGTRLPLFVYVMRLTAQSLIRFCYALVGCGVILWLSGVPLTTEWIWSFVALILIATITPAAITVFAMAGTFYPDFQFIISNVMRLGMFLTPIFWINDDNMLRDALYQWNPFTYFIEIVRIPIVENRIPVGELLFCFSTGLIIWVMAILILGKYRRQLVFVL